MFSKTFLLSALASVATAHIVITSPQPYGSSSLDNSPLLADGSDFPCKQRSGVYALDGASNVYKQGSTQQLAFKGTAVHGGGSCQVSITTDKEPTKDSVWKVIKSIEGGCPAKNQAGNIGDDANAAVPYKYDYTIPDELAAGDYTLAWTWFNKVGNREMYMNCAPLTVEGSAGDDGLLDTLPDLFVANIGNGCTVLADKDAEFPNPGKDVDKFNGATDAFYVPTGAACGAATGGSGGGDTPAPTTTADSGSEPPATTSAPAATQTQPGGIFITVSDSPDPVVTAAPTTTAPAADPPATTAPTTPGDGGSDGGSGDGSSFAQGTACSTEGDWNCVGGSSFQRCASGMWSAVQGLASGTSCEAGQSSTLNMVSKRGTRAMRRAVRMAA